MDAALREPPPKTMMVRGHVGMELEDPRPPRGLGGDHEKRRADAAALHVVDDLHGQVGDRGFGRQSDPPDKPDCSVVHARHEHHVFVVAHGRQVVEHARCQPGETGVETQEP